MLKEVGASGQISLRKRFANQLFDGDFLADCRVELLPMRAVAMARPAPAVEMTSPDGWVSPAGYARCTEWALEAYAARIGRHGAVAEQWQQPPQSGDGVPPG